MNLIALFVVKVVDNLIGTGKTLLIQKGREVLASVLVVFSQVLFFMVISNVISSNDMSTIWITSIGAGIGTFLAMQINKRFSKDRVYISNIFSDDKDAMIELSNHLKENKVKNLITDSYTKDWGETLAITTYADTKSKQKLVDSYIEKSQSVYLKIDN